MVGLPHSSRQCTACRWSGQRIPPRGPAGRQCDVIASLCEGLRVGGVTSSLSCAAPGSLSPPPLLPHTTRSLCLPAVIALSPPSQTMLSVARHTHRWLSLEHAEVRDSSGRSSGSNVSTGAHALSLCVCCAAVCSRAPAAAVHHARAAYVRPRCAAPHHRCRAAVRGRPTRTAAPPRCAA